MVTEVKVLIIVGIIFALAGVLLLLADDSRKFLFDKTSYPEEKKILKSWAFWKLCIQFTIVFVIYNGGALMGRMSWGATVEDKLWNPYIFGGMPRYAAGSKGLNTWNQLEIFINATHTLLWTNPLGMLLFILSGMWMMRRYLEHKKWIWANYILVIIVELLMISTARWNV